MPNIINVKDVEDDSKAVVSVSIMAGRRNRGEHEGLPYGVMASHVNWPSCK